MATLDPEFGEFRIRRPRRPMPWRPILSFALLVTSALILGAAIRRAQEYPSARATPQVTPITDRSDHAARQHDAVGKFATGDKPGDRSVVIKADGHVDFTLVGANDPAFRDSDTWNVAMLDRQPCITTAHSGLIEMVDIDHVQYCGDVYERTK